MSKTIYLALSMLALLSAGTTRDKFAAYRAVDAYEVRPGILMLPKYSGDGQVCEIGLQRLHYTPGRIRLDSGLSREEIDRIFQEIVPASERGAALSGTGGELITRTGDSITMSTNFENVSIDIIGEVSRAPGHGGYVVRNVVATLRWLNRQCR